MSLITTSENKNKKVVDITVQIPYNEIKKGGEKMKNSRIELRVSQEEKENLKTATFVRKVVLDYIENKK